MTKTLNTFKIGDTVAARSVGDYNAIWNWTVTDRTAKFITLIDRDGKTTRVGVKTDAQGEWALPLGKFSMAPVIRAFH